MDPAQRSYEAAVVAARERKTFEMERSVSWIRAIVITVNVTVYFTLVGLGQPRALLALSVTAVAIPYAIWSLFGRPYERFPLLRFGALTLMADVALTSAWVLGTGGATSDFWIIYVISVVSVAMRYDLKQTVIAAIGEASICFVVLRLDGLTGPNLVVRPSYIIIAGFAAGLLARMERVSREERIVAQSLAADNERLLIVEREAVERLEGLDKLKTEFVAMASHELRTPLTTLAGWATMLSEKRGTISEADLTVALDSMGRQGERARDLINNLLDLSRLESKEIPMDLKVMDIRAAVEAALTANPAPVDVAVSIDVPEGLRAMGDAGRFEQVLLNLLTNAYRYGGPNVSIRSVPGDMVTLLVEDDGMGIPEEEAAIVFEPFNRGSNANGSQGSGLGLTVSSRLLSSLGGTLTYAQRAEGGSEFTLTLTPAA